MLVIIEMYRLLRFEIFYAPPLPARFWKKDQISSVQKTEGLHHQDEKTKELKKFSMRQKLSSFQTFI